MRRPSPLLALPLLFFLVLGCADSGSRGATRDRDGDAGTDSTDRDGSAPPPARPLPDAGFEACETASAVAEPLPATLLFQVDTSGSMNCAASDPSCLTADPGEYPESRYDVFRRVLLEALGDLPDSTRAGLMHYPVTFSCAQDALTVPIDTLGVNRDAIGAALEDITPEGITPTHDGVLYALGRLESRPAEENRFLVLATDGAATVCEGCDTDCSWDDQDEDNAQMVEDIGVAAEAGIPTFVIGVPGSQSFSGSLSEMASAAGTARSDTCSDAGPAYCHYDLTDASLDFGAALREALADIGESVISCEYDIPPNPDGAFDPAKVNVRLTEDDGTERTIPRDTSRTDGWDYTDEMDRIILHGPACDEAQSLTTGRIDVLFGCPTILI